MDSPLLQRIVGAVVLVALGVIFIPILLDGSGYRLRHQHDITFKPKPEFPPINQKQVPQISSPLQKIRQKIQQKPRQKKAGANVAEKISGQSDRGTKPIHAFALQVGTFKDNKNAEKLRDTLRKAGYVSFIIPVAEKNSRNYKVQIGPELDKSQLLQIKDKVKEKFGLDGYVVNYAGT